MRFWLLLIGLAVVQGLKPSPQLPAPAVAALVAGLAAATQGQASNIWRDRAPLDADSRLVGLVEIARGDRRKFEFDLGANAMRLDRTIPAALGGYPVNYGIVPQTISYDGDPFDVLVLGPALASGTLVNGTAVGIMYFEDEKGPDSKVVLSPLDQRRRPQYQLTAEARARMTRFFNAYKRHEPGKFSRVTGWGTGEEGMAAVRLTHAFFTECRAVTTACVVTAR